MENELLEKTEFAVIIPTIRGKITIDCDPESLSVGYHYKPIDRMDPYSFGPIKVNGTTDRKQIQSMLRQSWLPQDLKVVERIDNAARLVFALAQAAKITQTIASIVRLVDQANVDGVERVIGVLVNSEDGEDE